MTTQPPKLRDNNAPIAPPNPVSQPDRVPQGEFAPAASNVPQMALEATQFAYGEAPSVLQLNPTAIVFQVDHTLRQRKIYAWLWTNPSNAADYFVRCEIQFYRGQTKIGYLPLGEAISAAANSVVPQTIVAIGVGSIGGVETKDCIAIYPALPQGTQPTGIILQPQCIYAEFDEIRLAVVDMKNMTGIRLWLGCISSKQ
jgi:hypothetical protein